MALYEFLRANMPASIVQWTTPIQAWVPGITPMSTLPSVFIASAAYLVLVLGGQEIMRFFPAVPAKYVKIPFFIHNLLLSLGSLVLLLLYLERQFLLIRQYDLHDSICRANLFEQSEMFHIINYYFKYWEFVDTFFLVIKKKNLMFLHVYHHMATAMLCYSQIVNRTTLSWVIICLNLAVHVIMYSYYAFASIGIRCPWKKWITTGQILQFVIDVAVCVYGSMYFVYVCANPRQFTTTTPPRPRSTCLTCATAMANLLQLSRVSRSWSATCSSLFCVRMPYRLTIQSTRRHTRSRPRPVSVPRRCSNDFCSCLR